MPMMTPSATPAKPKSRLIGCSETEKPNARLEINSMSAASYAPAPDSVGFPAVFFAAASRRRRCIQNTSGVSLSTQRRRRGSARWCGEFAAGVPRRRVLSSRDVVDETRFADTRGDQQADRTVLERLDRLERFGVARFEIIEGEAGALDGGAALIEDARGEFAACDFASAILKHSVKRGRRCAFARREIAIARG